MRHTGAYDARLSRGESRLARVAAAEARLLGVHAIESRLEHLVERVAGLGGLLRSEAALPQEEGCEQGARGTVAAAVVSPAASA